MLILILIIIFVLGLHLGSFLNVLADRLPQNISPWRGRSRCDFCNKTLKIWDLVPLLSFFYLKGKCRYCHKKLSWQYPIVELVTGMIFALVSWSVLVDQTSITPLLLGQLICYLLILSAFLVIFIADVKYQIIPDEMLVVLIVVGFMMRILDLHSIIPYLLAGIGACLFFLAIYIVTRGKGMGFGDVKLVAVMGLLLGFPNIVIALYIAFLTGAALSLILILAKKKRLKSRVAFGPFLVAGYVMSLIFGATIAQWYLNFFI